MSSPRTSVIIPTYNRASMVLEAAKSALSQDVPVRVVVVDDGSTDDTPARLAEFARDVGAGELTLIRQENKERGAARNRGAAEFPEAEFLLFLDADDFLEKAHVRKLELLADQNPEAPLVFSAGVLSDENLHPFGRLGKGSKGEVDLERFVLGKEVLPPTFILVRATRFREVGGFHEDRALSGSEDWLLNAQMLSLGPGVGHGHPTARVRRHEGNTMADPGSMLASMLQAHDRFFNASIAQVPTPPLQLRSRSRSRLLLRGSTQFYAVGRAKEARAHLRQAVREDLSVLLEPLWGWTLLRSVFPHRVTRRLRKIKTRVQTKSGS